MSKKRKKSQPVISKAEKSNIIGTITAKEIRTMQTKGFIRLHGMGVHGDTGYNRRKERRKFCRKLRSRKTPLFMQRFSIPIQ